MVLRKYTSELTKCLSSQEQLPLVAVSLYARALISDEVKHMVINGKDNDYLKAAKLMSAVEKQVNTVPGALMSFLEVLQELDSGQSLADQILKEIETNSEEKPHLVHQSSSETRKSNLVRQRSISQDDFKEWTERQPSPSSSGVMTTMSSNGIQTPALSSTTVTQPSTTNYLPTCTQQATGLATTPTAATAATLTSRVQQPLSSDSEACSVSNLRLACEVHNATTGSIIKGANTTVYRDIVIKKKYSSVPPGTPLCVQVKANRACYIYIINIGSSGKVATLIPNEYEPHNLLTPDTTLVFPSKEADYEFELDNHSGEETLVLLAYSTQCNTEQAERDCLRLKKETTTYRDITIKKKSSQAPSDSCCDQRNLLGFLEVQFSVK